MSNSSEVLDAASESSALAVLFHPKTMLAVPVVVLKQEASVAVASSDWEEVERMERSGGAAMVIVGMGITARVTEREDATLLAPRKLVTTSTKVNCCPPSSTSVLVVAGAMVRDPGNTMLAVLPAARRTAITAS